MKKIFLFLLAVYATGWLIIVLNYFNLRNLGMLSVQSDFLGRKKSIDINFSQEKNADIIPNEVNKFDDPILAYHFLKKLDIFESGESEISKKKTYKKHYFGTDINDNYCDEHRAYFANHPEYIFAEKNFMTDFRPRGYFRSAVIPSVGQDLHPKIWVSMPEEQRHSFFEKLKPEINIFYTQETMYAKRLVGKHFSCLTQISNHCPGHDTLYRKDEAGQALVTYAKQYKTRPQCFSTAKFFPETWVMLKPDQCRDFFKIFNSREYFKLKKERNIVYMRKIGAFSHRGEGVFPVNDEEEEYIRDLYANGTKCDEVTENNLIQTFIHNPLLIENRKFNFRVFLYVASTNPFIAYYHDGYLRISFQEYDTKSTVRETFVTNLGMTTVLFQDKEGVGNMTAQEIKGESYMFYPEFHGYLMEQGKVTDPDWLNNYLRLEMKKTFVHLIRMAQGTYWRKSSITELYGVDFMMDENLNLWFIEANSMPLINGWDGETKKFFEKMLKDVFEISFGLLRSRTKRIIGYVNSLIREKDTWTFENETLILKNLEERREEFRELTMNRFEPEFEPSRDNDFSQIIDENLEGRSRYFGLLEKECL